MGGVVTPSTSMGGVTKCPFLESASKPISQREPPHSALTISRLEKISREEGPPWRRSLWTAELCEHCSRTIKRGMRIPLVDMEIGVQIRSQTRRRRRATCRPMREIVIPLRCWLLMHAHCLEVEAARSARLVGRVHRPRDGDILPRSPSRLWPHGSQW